MVWRHAITRKNMHTAANDLQSRLLVSYFLLLARTSWPFNTPAYWLCRCVITHPESIIVWASSVLFRLFFTVFFAVSRPVWIRSRITRSQRQPRLLNFRAFGIPSIWPVFRRHHWLRLNTVFILPLFPLLLWFWQSQHSTECSLNSSQSYPKQESTWIIHFL